MVRTMLLQKTQNKTNKQKHKTSNKIPESLIGTLLSLVAMLVTAIAESRLVPKICKKVKSLKRKIGREPHHNAALSLPPWPQKVTEWERKKKKSEKILAHHRLPICEPGILPVHLQDGGHWDPHV